MNDILKSKLEIIANDELLIQAIKEVFEERLEKERPNIEIGDTDDLLGSKFRAFIEAKKILEGGFMDLMSYRGGQKSIRSFNKEK